VEWNGNSTRIPRNFHVERFVEKADCEPHLHRQYH
jgi:hypothetical protein